jgi:hypothetical protein
MLHEAANRGPPFVPSSSPLALSGSDSKGAT